MFFAFAGGTYYPCGGMHDYRGAFATPEAAMAAVEVEASECAENVVDAMTLDWAQIATIVNGELVVVWELEDGEWVKVGAV